MKYKKLVGKFEKLVEKHQQGHTVKPGKFDKLQGLLEAKRSRYREKLETTDDAEKRRKLETRIRVVEAQLEKSRQLDIAD